MIEIAGGIVLGFAMISLLGLFPYFFIWLVTGRGRPPKSADQIARERMLKRQADIRNLKVLGYVLAGMAVYVGALISYAYWSR